MSTMVDDDRVLTFRDLKEKKGWPFTAVHTLRLVKAGKVPKPFKADGESGLNLWLESDIDAYLSGRAKSARGTER